MASTESQNAALSAGRCAHCGSALPSYREDEFCCEGCRAVYALMHENGLARYYDLNAGRGAPVAIQEPNRDRVWLESIQSRVRAANGISRVELDVQGMHCAGCVWVMSALFARAPGNVDIVANATLGRLILRVEPSFDLFQFVDEIERFGYRVGPPLKTRETTRDDLLVRTALAFGLAGNAMMFALAMYLGLHEGALYEVMRTLELVLAVLAVLVGAPVFVSAAWAGLRRGVLHLDLPIALGMILALGGSIWTFESGHDAGYADSVAVFVALMLLGRWLQTRAVSQNRDRLLRSEGAGGLAARRLRDGELRAVRASEVRSGDRLLVAPGEVAVVDGLVDRDATISLDWISGESEARCVERGSEIAAGAINRGSAAFVLEARSGFDESPLESLLGAGDVHPAADERTSVFWDRVARIYVVAVLIAASCAFAFWWATTLDFMRALEIATAVLVVTCPCGIGIATPLAYELVTSALRRRGLFVRRERALERAGEIQLLAFDKTGTLTTGKLELAASIPELATADRQALSDLVARSAHPKSEAVRRALGESLTIRDGVEAVEEPSRGIRASIDGDIYRLGSPSFALTDPSGASSDLVFSKNGLRICELETREIARVDAARELHTLIEDGYRIAVLTGDTASRASALARSLGLPDIAIHASCSPEDKARWIDAQQLECNTLFVGDGINDGPASDRALISGTPAIDRPFLPARTDFFFVTPGLSPIRSLLEGAHALKRVVRRNLILAIAYNGFAVSLAVAGWMRPWLAAVLMPLSSLVVVGATTWSLRESQWTAGRARRRSRPNEAPVQRVESPRRAETSSTLEPRGIPPLGSASERSTIA